MGRIISRKRIGVRYERVASGFEGFNLRSAAAFVKRLRPFQSQVVVIAGEAQADGRDMMQLMTLFVYEGSKIVIRADGPDARECVEDLTVCLGLTGVSETT
jgi:phosphotransferase system HPr (HPr) family protein